MITGGIFGKILAESILGHPVKIFFSIKCWKKFDKFIRTTIGISGSSSGGDRWEKIEEVHRTFHKSFWRKIEEFLLISCKNATFVIITDKFNEKKNNLNVGFHLNKFISTMCYVARISSKKKSSLNFRNILVVHTFINPLRDYSRN